MNKLFIRVSCIVLTLSTLTTSAASIRWETFSADGDDPSVQLGRLDVPLRHAEPNGTTIEIAFVRLGSTAEKPGSPIVYLNGGPGQSATPYARSKGGVQSFSALREISDVILLDQRGTGLSQPDLRCPGEPPPTEGFFSDHYPLEPAVAYFAKCADHFEAKGIDLRAINTRESASDLDSIREALGAEQLSLLGFSYGTHLGLAAIRQLGDRIERAILVGTEGPDHTESCRSRWTHRSKSSRAWPHRTLRFAMTSLTWRLWREERSNDSNGSPSRSSSPTARVGEGRSGSRTAGIRVDHPPRHRGHERSSLLPGSVPSSREWQPCSSVVVCP